MWAFKFSLKITWVNIYPYRLYPFHLENYRKQMYLYIYQGLISQRNNFLSWLMWFLLMDHLQSLILLLVPLLIFPSQLTHMKITKQYVLLFEFFQMLLDRKQIQILLVCSLISLLYLNLLYLLLFLLLFWNI